MKTIIAVLEDLYTFAFIYRFGFINDPTETNQLNRTKLVNPTANDTNLNASQADPVTSKKTTPPEQKSPSNKTTGYIYTPDTPLYSLPTRIFDGIILRLPYAAPLNIINSQGKWVNIIYEDITGWVHYDNITESKVSLDPKFTHGETYNFSHPSTIKLRLHIDDSFNARDFALPLQDIEYTTYKLLQKKISISWGNERPRLAGTWQRLLKGALGVHISITPKTGTIMEYINSDNTGHVAYVESVYPDGSVAISEVGYPTDGAYAERTIRQEEWRELRPVFIEVA